MESLGWLAATAKCVDPRSQTHSSCKLHVTIALTFPTSWTQPQKKTDQITHSSYLYPLLHINSWAHWIWTDTCCQSSSKRTLCFWLSRPIFCVKWFVCVTNSHWISEWIQNKMDYVEKNPIIEQVDAFKLPLIRAHIDYLIDWRSTVIFANAWQMWPEWKWGVWNR